MKYVMTFMAGTLAGAIIALLFAPASGEELRTHIGERATAEQQRAQAEYQRKMEDMQTRMGKLQTDMQTLIRRSNAEDAVTTEASPEGYIVSE